MRRGEKIFSGLQRQTGQSVVEYFVLFAAVAAIGLLAVSSFFGKSQTAANAFFMNTANVIMGDVVQNTDMPDDVNAVLPNVPPPPWDECPCECQTDSDCGGLECVQVGFPNPFGNCTGMHCRCRDAGRTVVPGTNCARVCCSGSCHAEPPGCDPIALGCSYVCD